MLTTLLDLLLNVPPQAHVPILIGVSLTAGLLLASIASALHHDALDMAEAADLRRLTATLPDAAGRHRLGEACGTPTQQRFWHDDTASFSPAELWEALRAEPTGAGQ